VLAHVLKAIERLAPSEGYDIPPFGCWLWDMMELQASSAKIVADLEGRRFGMGPYIGGALKQVDKAFIEHQEKQDYRDLRVDFINAGIAAYEREYGPEATHEPPPAPTHRCRGVMVDAEGREVGAEFGGADPEGLFCTDASARVVFRPGIPKAAAVAAVRLLLTEVEGMDASSFGEKTCRPAS
jgi:hypothetical protein